MEEPDVKMPGEVEETKNESGFLEFVKQPWMLMLAVATLAFGIVIVVGVPKEIAKVGFIIGSGWVALLLGSGATAMKSDAPLSGFAMFCSSLTLLIAMMFALGLEQFKDAAAEGVAVGVVGLTGGIYHAAQERANRARGIKLD